MSVAKKHHQVPQFLLRNFAFNDRTQLHAFDKHRARCFPISVGDAAAQNGFYRFDLGQESVSIESALAQLETDASQAIDRIVRQESLAQLSDADRANLALFVCVQWNRSPNCRLMQQDLAKKFEQFVVRFRDATRPGDPLETEDLPPGDVLALASIAEARRWVPLVLEKKWVLQRVAGQHCLFVGDSPLTLHNSREFGPYGNLGFAVPGIEIQLPLSSRLNLWMICPTIFHELERGHKIGSELKAAGHDSAEADRAIRLVECIRTGGATEISQDNVTFFNSLQVMYAARFVYSEDGDFALVRRMLTDDAKYRDGIRFTM